MYRAVVPRCAISSHPNDGSDDLIGPISGMTCMVCCISDPNIRWWQHRDAKPECQFFTPVYRSLASALLSITPLSTNITILPINTYNNDWFPHFLFNTFFPDFIRILISITMPRCSGCRRDMEERAFDRNRQEGLYRTCRHCLISYTYNVCSFW